MHTPYDMYIYKSLYPRILILVYQICATFEPTRLTSLIDSG